MPQPLIQPQTFTSPRTPGRTGLGDRVRQLRINRGLTQTDLAGDRFSKEYLSQIERGKTRPTGETVEWLASRLGVDRSFLETGVSSSDRDRAEGVVSRAEAAIEAHEYAEAVQMLTALRDSLENASAPRLELRALLAESWARMYMSEIRVATEILGQARELAEGPEFTDVDRAEVLFRLGCCRWNLSSIATAVGALHRGARARRPLVAAVRSAALQHPRLAEPLSPAPARLGSRARGRRARARARRGARRREDDRAPLLPGLAHR